MNKRQRKKKQKQSDLSELQEKITAFVSAVDKIMNQQRVLTEYYKGELERLAGWKLWEDSLPLASGLYVALQKGYIYGLFFVGIDGGYFDRNMKPLSKQKIANIVAWIPVADIPADIRKGFK